jgi:hypothetical protein
MYLRLTPVWFLNDDRDVAVQVENVKANFETSFSSLHRLKVWVTRRFRATGQLDLTCTAGSDNSRTGRCYPPAPSRTCPPASACWRRGVPPRRRRRRRRRSRCAWLLTATRTLTRLYSKNPRTLRRLSPSSTALLHSLLSSSWLTTVVATPQLPPASSPPHTTSRAALIQTHANLLLARNPLLPPRCVTHTHTLTPRATSFRNCQRIPVSFFLFSP